MDLQKGNKVIVKGKNYEVMNVEEEAATSRPKHVKSYTAVYLKEAGDDSEEISLVLEIREDDTFMITSDRKRKKLKDDEFKLNP